MFHFFKYKDKKAHSFYTNMWYADKRYAFSTKIKETHVLRR